MKTETIHNRLLQLKKILHDALTGIQNSPASGQELYDVFCQVFAAEETFMLCTGYPDQEIQTAAHRQLLDSLAADLIPVRDLKRWISQHELYCDRHFLQWLNDPAGTDRDDRCRGTVEYVLLPVRSARF